MITCTYCDKEAVLVSGRNYCADHLGKYETRFFERAAGKVIRSALETKRFLEWAFGTDTPRLSDLARWHHQIHRGKWVEEEAGEIGHWEMGQDEYIGKIAEEYVTASICKHRGMVTHSNGVGECPQCHTLWADRTDRMRNAYGGQPRVIWRES
jgi:hypothetical protein